MKTETAIAAVDFRHALNGVDVKEVKAGDEIQVNVKTRQGTEDAGYILPRGQDFSAAMDAAMVRKTGGDFDVKKLDNGDFEIQTVVISGREHFSGMAKSDLDAYAQKEFGVNLDGRAKAETLIAKIRVLTAARASHRANKSYCEGIGDDSQPSWADAPDWQRESAIAGVEFHIANPDADDAASHGSWLAQKEADGWSYGEVKDTEAKTHPCMVEYEDLPPEQQAKDALFRETVAESLKAFDAAA